MKKIHVLFSLVLALNASAQVPDTTTTRFRGEYFGIVLPAGTACTTERLLLSVDVDAAGEMHGEIVNWQGVRQASIAHRLDWRGKFSFNTGTNLPVVDAGWGGAVTARGRARPGTLRGTIDGRTRGACRYTFTVWRRMKNN